MRSNYCFREDWRREKIRRGLPFTVFTQPQHHGFKLQVHVTLYDSFKFRGPHGKYICLVTEALSVTLDHVHKSNNEGHQGLSVAVTKRLAKQISSSGLNLFYVSPLFLQIISYLSEESCSPICG